ncbi:hypothetical protein SMF913_28270 [Streptomyces malaysiensis]|uniref:Uncharacterized protein n=1 Tax=Streptomyces malaysiensis TaxID=92644 RepID=A0A2J7YXQ1_STRMQ|nr:hypothetical protein SMF913_28270 [Streptomyces malaysiensis]
MIGTPASRLNSPAQNGRCQRHALKDSRQRLMRSLAPGDSALIENSSLGLAIGVIAVVLQQY